MINCNFKSCCISLDNEFSPFKLEAQLKDSFSILNIFFPHSFFYTVFEQALIRRLKQNKGEVNPQNHSIDIFSVFSIQCQICLLWNLIWKKVEEYLRLFETYVGIRFSLFLVSGLRKLICFSGRMSLRMKLIAQKELIFLFQMAPSRTLWDQQFSSYDFFNLSLFFRIFRIFFEDQYFSLILILGSI